MEGKVNYTVVGVFVVVLTLLLFSSIFWLSAIGQGKTYHTYEVLLREDVTGLSNDSPVRFNGVKVGFVDSIKLDKNNPRLVRIILKIEPDVLITESTYAILNEQGITGVVNVNLKAQTESAKPLLKTAGEPYPVIPSRPSLLMQLSSTLPELASNFKELSSSISELMDPKNRKAISDSLQNIAEITNIAANNAQQFSNIIENMDKTLQNVSDASDQFPNAMARLNTTLTSINRASTQMGETLTNFSNQVLPNAEEALTNLSNVSNNMNELSIQLQRNPSMLIRGRTPPTPGPGEK